jgi:hypothetical protein
MGISHRQPGEAQSDRAESYAEHSRRYPRGNTVRPQNGPGGPSGEACNRTDQNADEHEDQAGNAGRGGEYRAHHIERVGLSGDKHHDLAKLLLVTDRSVAAVGKPSELGRRPGPGSEFRRSAPRLA